MPKAQHTTTKRNPLKVKSIEPHHMSSIIHEWGVRHSVFITEGLAYNLAQIICDEYKIISDERK